MARLTRQTTMPATNSSTMGLPTNRVATVSGIRQAAAQSATIVSATRLIGDRVPLISMEVANTR